MAGTTSIDGLISGLNTTQIIDSLMALERRPAVLLEADQAEKTNIVSALKALQAKLMALSSDVSVLTRRATYETAAVKISDDAILSATATGRGVVGSYDLQVLSLARNHQIASQGFSDQSLALFGAGTISLSVGGRSSRVITVDASNNSLAGIKKAINDAHVGVTATIVNDGSTSSPYRLVLTADKPGAANSIKVTSALTGGQSLNYSTAVFDVPEWVAKNSGSTSQISLGPTATFSGSTNKIYTFTVRGTGIQTVGTDNITLDWTDGTNTGSVIVTQADQEVDLAVPGAQGLKLNFSSGKLVGGDSFNVQSFAPLLQAASDARVSIGNSGGTGSPIIITSTDNTLTDAIPGVTLKLRKETALGTPVTVTTDIDFSAIKDKITAFLKSFNDVKDYVDKQNQYNTETKESGVLFGDVSIQSMQNSLSSSLTSIVPGIAGKYNQLASIGIRTGLDGRLSLRDASRLEDALRNDPDAVVNLLTNSGFTSSGKIEFVSMTDETKAGKNYDVDIIAAATRGYFQGANISDPGTTPLTLTSANNRIKLTVDGAASEEIVLDPRTYSSTTELVEELQARIDADAKIGTRGLKVSWMPITDTTGHLVFTSSIYGSNSKVNLITGVASAGFNALGLSQGQATFGIDVQGTINGEKAEGTGQYLTGKAKNKTTAGLKLKVTLDTFQVVSGVDATVTVAKGVASRLSETLNSITRSTDGFIDRRISSYQKQIDQIKTRITEFDAFLAIRREDLVKRYAALETTLAQLNATSTSLNNALAGLSNSFSTNSNRSTSNG